MAIGPDGLTVHLPLVIVYDVQRDDVAAKHKPSASPVYTERDTVTLGRFVAYYGASSMCMCVFLDDWRPLLHPSPQNGRMVDRSVGLDLHSEAVTRPGRWALPKFANFFFSSNASALVWHRLPDELFFFFATLVALLFLISWCTLHIAGLSGNLLNWSLLEQPSAEIFEGYCTWIENIPIIISNPSTLTKKNQYSNGIQWNRLILAEIDLRVDQ